jgi:hypothetical protein
VSHPLADVGRFVDDKPDADFAVRHDHFATRRFDDKIERDGLEMTFRGWTYSLEDYAVALAGAGLRIDTIREPRPTSAPPRYDQWNRVPMSLLVRAIKG